MVTAEMVTAEIAWFEQSKVASTEIKSKETSFGSSN